MRVISNYFFGVFNKLQQLIVCVQALCRGKNINEGGGGACNKMRRQLIGELETPTWVSVNIYIYIYIYEIQNLQKRT
jgi:hypothetical protein